MKRSLLFLAVAALATAACDSSPTAPPEVPIEPAAPAAEITAYSPAVDDVSNRILVTGEDPSLLGRLGNYLNELKVALQERRALRAAEAADRAQDLLDQCTDDCLIAQERSVIQLTLDHAKRLIGLD